MKPTRLSEEKNNLKKMEKRIKVLLRSACPHCGKDVLVEVESLLPTIKSFLTEEDITASKEYVKKFIMEDKTLSPIELEQAINWLNNEETAFGPSDTENVIDSILNKQ